MPIIHKIWLQVDKLQLLSKIRTAIRLPSKNYEKLVEIDLESYNKSISMNYSIKQPGHILTLSLTMNPVTCGLIIPGIVPIVLEIPIKIAAY